MAAAINVVPLNWVDENSETYNVKKMDYLLRLLQDKYH